ncbi:MAG: hypothetical protein EPO64_07840 [Nitrospirae bacterium]|nr:MAG: hypothetical protein EPO64_07840 [Nitrospirota bacterium]
MSIRDRTAEPTPALNRTGLCCAGFVPFWTSESPPTSGARSCRTWPRAVAASCLMPSWIGTITTGPVCALDNSNPSSALKTNRVSSIWSSRSVRSCRISLCAVTLAPTSRAGSSTGISAMIWVCSTATAGPSAAPASRSLRWTATNSE